MAYHPDRVFRRPLAEEARDPAPVLPIRDILNKLAAEDQQGFRTLTKIADEIADEHGIAQPSQASKSLSELGYSPKPETAIESPLPLESTALVPYTNPEPIKQLADTLSRFTFGTMMQVSKELRAIEHADFNTPEGIAALLHSWATKTLQT